MPKPDRSLTELKRQVRLLLALEGRVLRLASGIWLVRAGRVAVPVALQALIQAPAFARNALKACLTPDAHCEPLSRQHLAAATHALAVLQMHVQELTQTPARWLGGQRRDVDWLRAQRRRVQRLSTWLGATAQAGLGPALSSQAQRAVTSFPMSEDALCAWFDVDALPPLDARGAALAWLCDQPPSATLALDGIDDAAFARALLRIAAHGPRCADSAAALLTDTRSWSAPALDAWWPWLAQGVPAAAVAAWPDGESGRRATAPPADWPLPAVRVYVQLAASLLRAPGGARLPLQPESFARLAVARKPTLVALAAVLDQLLHADAGAIEQTLALADTALRMDGRLGLPVAIEVQPGLAAATDADFADWLGDDLLIDRYLSLRRALGEPVEISLRLRHDHAALRRNRSQQQFLQSLDADDPRRAQLARLGTTADPTRTRRRLEAECVSLELRWRMAEVDRTLRQALGRVLGTQMPRWDEAWRDAARLYLGVDVNHEELKGLLRAAAAGHGAEWRIQLPGNDAWLQRAAEKLDVAAWLAPPTHAFPWRGEVCTLTAERDPLQALRMGLPFDSCLALDAGCNRHSAIINALDANKWVVYLRDRKGRILARQLLAISSEWRLLGYRVYTSIGTSDGLIDAFGAYARDLAQACEITRADAGTPETLNGCNWYDDGTWPWRASDSDARPQQIAAYAGEIGVALPETASPEFVEEARRWSLARTGHIEALQTWCDTRPSGLRNLALLQQRYGERGVLRLLGDALRHDRYRYELQREAPLGVLLKLGPQLHDPGRVGFGRDLGNNAIDAASMRAAIRALLATDAGARFDDDGLEHALLTLIPRWAETLPFDELAPQLPLMASAFDRLCRGLPDDCSDCVSAAEDWLLLALRSAWRRAPDSQRMLRLLGARHDSPRLPRWLLALAAREHLSAPAALPVFAPPLADRRAARALDAMVARHPQLRTDPLRLAATLRHSDPATLDVEAIDWPAQAPWAALGDAICDWPTLWPALRRYARRPGDLSPCSVFEAHWARQVRSAWHAALPGQVAALDEDSVAAAQIVADLGLPALLDECRALLRQHAHRARRQPKRAQQIREILSHSDADGSLGAIARDWLRLAQPEPGEVEIASVCMHAQARVLADALIDLSTPPVWATSLLLRVLPGSFNPHRCLRLWQHPALHELADLAAPQAWSACHARRLLQQWPTDLGEHWLVRALQAGNTDLVDEGPIDWFTRLAGLAADHCPPETWLTLYREVPDALAASVFVSALDQRRRAAIRELTAVDAAHVGAWDWLLR